MPAQPPLSHRLAGRISIAATLCAAIVSASRLRAGDDRWMLYLAVSCLVIISLWTLAALRDTVSRLNLKRTAALTYRRGLKMSRQIERMFPGCGMYGAASVALVVLGSFAGFAQHTQQVAQPLLFFPYMLISLFAVRACYPRASTRVAAVSGDHRDLKAVQS
jgi:hypothetical protein